MKGCIRNSVVLLLVIGVPFSSGASALVSSDSEGGFEPYTTNKFDSAIATLASAETPQSVVAYDPDLDEPSEETERAVKNLEAMEPSSTVASLGSDLVF